ncbi:hypothetical protein ACUR5C_04210 [Aliikangiella sp. IMCC44653]
MISPQLITETLTLLLPQQAELEIEYRNGDYHAKFCWLLNNDPSRPYKRSKKVHFIVKENALYDFANLSNKVECLHLKNLESYLAYKIARFNPDHDLPEGVASPVEVWEVDSLLFLQSLDKLPGFTPRLF